MDYKEIAKTLYSISKTKDRFCQYQRREKKECLDCILYKKTNKSGYALCTAIQTIPTIKDKYTCDLDDVENAIKFLLDWEKEHPQKTYIQDFFEKFPNAKKCENGMPMCCRNYIYNKNNETYCFKGIKSCYTCWNEQMPEEEEE